MSTKTFAFLVGLCAVLAVVVLSKLVGKTAACLIVGSLSGVVSLGSFWGAFSFFNDGNSGHTAGLANGFAGIAFAMLGILTGLISVVCFITALF